MKTNPPDPDREIRLLSLTALQGANYWSVLPVTRLDLALGAYDEISSAEIAGFPEGLLSILPGLIEHRCSIGRRGGFLLRLRTGTYVPHILEHVALELQSMAGFDVGFGRARSGDRAGEYTVVFEHRHARVGARAGELALTLVRNAFAQRFESVEAMVGELMALGAEPEPVPIPERRVTCGVIGGELRTPVRDALLRLVRGDPDEIVDLSAAQVLSGGLPYGSSRTAIVLGTALPDLPVRYREPVVARRLCSVVIEAVKRGGYIVIPAGDAELERIAKEADVRTVTFGRAAVAPYSRAHAAVVGDLIVLRDGCTATQRPIDPRWPPEAQAAAVAAAHILERSGR